MRSRWIMTTTSSKTERKRTHDSRVWLVSSAVPYGRTPAVFVICKMQKLKEKKNRFAICFEFYLFLPLPPSSRGCQGRRRYRRRRREDDAVGEPWNQLFGHPFAHTPLEPVVRCSQGWRRWWRSVLLRSHVVHDILVYTHTHTHTHKHRMHLMHWPT